MPEMFFDGQTCEEFLKDYYAVGLEGYLSLVGGLKPRLKQIADIYQVGQRDLKKIYLAEETNYLNNRYGMAVTVIGHYNSEIFKLLDKKPITTVGDSFKYVKETTNYGLLVESIHEEGTLFGTPTEPSVTAINNIYAAITKVVLAQSLHAKIRETLPDAMRGGTDWSWLANDLSPKAFWNFLDKKLGGKYTANAHGVDTPASTDIECIDRMVSSKAESGSTNKYVSASSDGDIDWDSSSTPTTRIDRSTTAYDAQLQLPTTVVVTGKAWDIMNELEDLMIAAKPYSENKRYIALMPDAAATLIEREFSAEARFIFDREAYIQETINGVNTRAGAKYGHPVRALVLAGVECPVFTSASALPSDNAKFTTDGWGHIYLIDLDSMYIRVDLPATYGETGWDIGSMIVQNSPRSRGMLMGLYQLVCTKFASNAKLCYLADGS